MPLSTSASKPSPRALWVDTDGNGAVNDAEVAVANDDIMVAANITNLTFEPLANENASPYATFDFEVYDGTSYSTKETITININPSNDAPTAADFAVNGSEDVVHTFTSGEFSYSDTEANPFTQLRLQPATIGTLWVDADGDGTVSGAEAAVVANDVVTIANLPKLSFVGALNANNSPYATFLFEVHDGIQYSDAQNTCTIN